MLWMDQLLPFHRSAKAANASPLLLLPTAPTAMHALVEVQDTP
jgi:hypothetical protein